MVNLPKETSVAEDRAHLEVLCKLLETAEEELERSLAAFEKKWGFLPKRDRLDGKPGSIGDPSMALLPSWAGRGQA